MPTRYSPVRHSCTDLPTVIFPSVHPFDLHVLGTPPAFILSQDQTLMFVRLPAAVPSAGFTVLFGSMGFSMDCLFFEFPLNFPLRFPLPSCSPFTGLTGFPLLRSSWNFQGCIAVHLPRFGSLPFFSYFAGNEIEYITSIPRLSTHFLKFFQVFFQGFFTHYILWL